MKPTPAERKAKAYTWAKREFPLEPATRAAFFGFRAGYAAALRAVAKLKRRPRAVFIQVGCDRHPSGPRGRVSLGQICTCKRGYK